jgi:hypothetical protein
MSTVTLLQAMNAVMKRTRNIQGDAGELATSTVTSTATGLTATEAFTDGSRQNEIDIGLQLWNEAMHEVFGLGLFAQEMATATMTLVTDTREYALPSDFERLAGNEDQQVIRAATEQYWMFPYDGGYQQMLINQNVASDWRGKPNAFALSPSTANLRVDLHPTADENGTTWNYNYEKRLGFSSTMATSTFPFSDTVVDCLVPVVSEAHNRIFKQEFDAAMFKSSIVRAIDYIRQRQRKSFWGPRPAR